MCGQQALASETRSTCHDALGGRRVAAPRLGSLSGRSGQVSWVSNRQAHSANDGRQRQSGRQIQQRVDRLSTDDMQRDG